MIPVIGKRAQLISIDSMKVYRGMDIGTAKPKRPHRLVNICDAAESYNAGRFVRGFSTSGGFACGPDSA